MQLNFDVSLSPSQQQCSQLTNKANFEVIGAQYAHKLSLKDLKSPLGQQNYLVINLEPGSLCIVFDYGTTIFFNCSVNQQSALLKNLEPFAQTPCQQLVTESMQVLVGQSEDNQVHSESININQCSPEHIILIADVLSKSIKMEQFEDKVADSFRHVEPIAKNLKLRGKLDHSSTQLLKHIGESLLTEHESIGRVEMTEKPNVLWENVQLEPLYYQMMDEFEILDRQTILDKKLELTGRTAQTSLEVLQHRHASRLEWYIIILIMVSICIELYALYMPGH